MDSKIAKRLLWVGIVASPLLAALIIGVITGTAPWAIDAWNSAWNDEQTYFNVAAQMRLYGEPTGIAGYNEVMAERSSYGPYTPVVFLPFYVGSFLTGLQAHNYIYLINVAYGLLAMGLLVLLLRPTVRESALCMGFFTFQLIIGRYVFSGMSEASYLVLAVLLSCGAVWVLRAYREAEQANAGGRVARIVAAIVLMAVAVGFWGMMRAYLLALILVPLALLVVRDCCLHKAARVALGALCVVVAIASLMAFVYFEKYHVAPYFDGSSIANSMSDLLLAALGNFGQLHLDAFLFLGKSLVKLDWTGIMAGSFALEWVVLLVMAIRAGKGSAGSDGSVRAKSALVLEIAALAAGFAIFEANLLLYTPRQMHRSLIVLVVVYALLVIFLSGRNGAPRRITAPVVVVLFTAVTCVGALVTQPDEFAFPQEDAVFTVAVEDDARLELADLMPYSSDAWDNTVVHPIENQSFQIYYCMPAHMAMNCYERQALGKALKEGTLKSKYLCMPDDYQYNDLARSKYELVYQGMGHNIYRLH